MFIELLRTRQRRQSSLLCIGIDPDPARIPAQLGSGVDGLRAFCRAIVDATADLACALKPNSAFFEAYGPAGFAVLQELIAQAPPELPIILDVKRGDIGSTAAAYATACFDQLGAHAVTLNPLLGSDSLAPFLNRAERGCFVLCRTSNPGAADLQDLLLADGRPFYLALAELARDRWNANANLGLVVGATIPDQLRLVRQACPGLPLLVPGIGSQGGDLPATLAAGLDASGAGLIINASRSILYASNGPDFAAAARREAQALRDGINHYRALA